VGKHMDWKPWLAYLTGSVDQELLVRNEYLVTENRILRQQITGRVGLSDGKGKVVLMPTAAPYQERDRPIQCRERLGGLLNYYHRKAA
jgi:hypothetical protein